MARIVECPLCNNTKKIKHNHYTNFVCCFTKFPIKEHRVFEYSPPTLNEQESEERVLEIDEAEDAPQPSPEDYDFQCAECGRLFNEEGNRNFFGAIKCPGCGLTNYGF